MLRIDAHTRRNWTPWLAITLGVVLTCGPSTASAVTKKWTGSVDQKWGTNNNWSPAGVPAVGDSVVLDNSNVATSYSVTLPPGTVSTWISRLTIAPTQPQTITLTLLSSNTANPGLAVGDSVQSTDDIIILAGGSLVNSSGAASGNGIQTRSTTTGTVRIANNGKYTHNTARSTAGIVPMLSSVSGTELGEFIYDSPGVGSVTISASGRTYGSLTLQRSAGAATYAATGASPLKINGNLKLAAGVTFSRAMTAAMQMSGNLTNLGAAYLDTSQVVFQGTLPQALTGTASIELKNPANSIAAGATLAVGVVTGGFTNSSTMTIDGTLRLDQGATMAGSGPYVYNAGSSLIFNNTLGTRVISNDAYWPAVNQPSTVTVQGAGGIAIASPRSVAGTLEVMAPVDVQSLFNLHIGGVLQLDKSNTILNNSPVYQVGSTLRYDGAGSPIQRSLEWPMDTNVPFQPYDVQVVDKTNFDLAANGGGAFAFTIRNDLQIDSVCVFHLDESGGATQPLTVSGDVRAYGGLYLSPVSGGDLILKGDLANAGLTTHGRTVSFLGTGPQRITGATRFDGLTLSNAAGLVLDGDVSVFGALTLLNGRISTGPNTLWLYSLSNISGASPDRYVNGNLSKFVDAKVTHTFEVGDSAGYAPVTLRFPGTVTANGMLTVAAIAGDHPQIGDALLNPARSVNRYWRITNQSMGFTSFNPTFTFNAGDLDPAADTSLLVVKRYSGGQWSPTTIGTRTATSTQAVGVTDVGEFAVAEPLNPVLKTWTGGGLDGQWATGANWAPAGAPTVRDTVLLDNANIATDYAVTLPVGAVSTWISRLTLSPTAPHKITLTLPSGNTADPGLAVGDSTAGTDDIVILAGGALVNASGAATGNGIQTRSTGTGSVRIANGGSYTHRTARTTAGIVPQLSSAAGTERGVFVYDSPGVSSVAIDVAGRTYGSLTLSRTAGAATYTAAGALPVTIRGNLTLGAGVTLKRAMDAALLLSGDLTNLGSAYTDTAQIVFQGSSPQAITGTTAITIKNRTNTIAAGATVAFGPVTGGFSNSDTLRVDGTVRIDEGGVPGGLGAFDYHSGSNLVFNNTTRIDINTAFTNPFWPSTSPVNVNVLGAGGINMVQHRDVLASIQTSAAVLNSNNLAIYGTAEIESGGSFTGPGSPFYETGSTLRYNSGGIYHRSAEWDLAFPYDVQISNNTTLDMGSSTSTASVLGKLTIDTGSTLSMALSAGMTVPLSVTGNLTNNGTLALSTAAGGDLKLKGDFANLGAFNPNGRTVSFLGTTLQTITGATAFSGLTLSNGAGLALASNISVASTLTLTNGKLNTGLDTLEITPTGVVSGGFANIYVIGNLKKPILVSGGSATQTFEVGDVAAYAPVTLSFAGTATASGSMTVSTTSGDHPDIGTSPLDPAHSVNRSWTITNAGTGFTSFAPTFRFNAGEVDAGATPGLFRVARFLNGAWNTTSPGSRTATSTQALGVTGVGDFAVAESSIVHFTITASAGANGSISPNGVVSVVSGANQSFTIAPAPGYQVAGVSVDGVSVGAVTTYNFTNLTANHTIMATFVDASVPTAQVVSPNGGESFAVGVQNTLHWTASDNVAVTGVTLVLSRNGAAGAFSDTLAQGIANTGSFNWTVTGPVTSNAVLKVVATDAAGNSGVDVSDAPFAIINTTGVDPSHITAFALAPIAPNPLRGTGNVFYALPREASVRLSIVDVQGREVKVLAEGVQGAGLHQVQWDGSTDRGMASAGMYFVRYQTPGKTLVRRLVFSR